MKLNPKNLYIKKHGDGYSVCIEMPDNSRNYLHNQPTDLPMAIMIMQDFDGDYDLGFHNTQIVKDKEYFRITLILDDGRGKPQTFHSRKLNLTDVVSEYQSMVNPE